MVKIYVGNLPFSTTEAEMRSAFEAHGQVASASIVMDRETGRPRGFGFIEMPNDAEAKAAIEKMHNANLGGRSLVVNEARPREARSGGGGGGGGGWGGGGGGGGRSGGGGGWGGGGGGRSSGGGGSSGGGWGGGGGGRSGGGGGGRSSGGGSSYGEPATGGGW